MDGCVFFPQRGIEIEFMANGKSSTAEPERIKALVIRLIEAGCDICAVGRGYTVNEPEDAEGSRIVDRILKDFGPRSHLTEEISACLRELGRYVEM